MEGFTEPLSAGVHGCSEFVHHNISNGILQKVQHRQITEWQFKPRRV